MEGEQTHEIGNIFGITSANVRTILYRARALMRSCLENHWFMGKNILKDKEQVKKNDLLKKKATQLLFKELEEPLSGWEKYSLKVHLLMCWCCTRFKKQIPILSKLLRDMAGELIVFERFAETGLPDLSRESKERILRVIKDAL